MRRKAKRYWLCRGCGTRNERVKQKCANQDCNRSRPKPRVPKHKITLQRDSYEFYCRVSEVLHGITDESCCVCGRPRAEERRHDRDHDHRTGHPRGIVCPLDNMLMQFTQLDAAKAQLIADYLKRAERYPEEFDGGSDG